MFGARGQMECARCFMCRSAHVLGARGIASQERTVMQHFRGKFANTRERNVRSGWFSQHTVTNL
eukprot:3603148-Rhodomonas_salina.1